MSQKLVRCKTCGAQIARSAKHCLNCGAKRSIAGKVIGITLGVLLIIGIAAAIGGSDDKPQKVGENTPPPDTGNPVQTKNEVFSAGDQVSLNDIVVTLVTVSTNSGGNYMTPSDGKEFVVCEFEIENNSDSDIGVSSILSFEAYIDDYATGMNLSAMLSTDKPQLDGTVAADKKMNGVIGYEADPGWSDIEIRFTPNFWSGTEIIFVASNPN